MHRLVRRQALLLSAVVLATTAPPAAAATRHRPVVFVHGYASDATTWTTMKNRFRNAGYTDAELVAWQYDYRRSNTLTAQDLARVVDSVRARTGWAKVDIVTHSMGGLSSRYYLKNLGGTAKVDDWVSLGGPNHGTTAAWFCGYTSCLEMRPGSNFLTALNSRDETPGAVAYATWWSPCDNVINPDSSVPVAGGVNTKTACVSHSALREDSTVFRQVKAAVAG